MRTITLRKAIYDNNLVVMVDRENDPITRLYGKRSRISVASIMRLERLLQDRMPTSVGFGSVGLLVRYTIPKIPRLVVPNADMCIACDGKGYIGFELCPDCGGYGYF